MARVVAAVLLCLACVALSAVGALGAAVEPAAPGGDTTGESPSAAPIVMVAPETGCVAQAGDVLQVMLVVREDLDVSAVAVLCDSRGIGLMDSSPYALSWDTAGLASGEHLLRAVTYLRSGEKLEAVPVLVTLTEAARALPPAAQTKAEQSVILKEGVSILLQSDEKLESGRTSEGSVVRFKVVRDVVAPGGKVLVAYGSFAQGKVTRSRGRGMFGKAGQLEFTVDTVAAVDGTAVPLRASEEMGGKDNKGVVIASTLVLSVFAVFVHGKDVVVPAGTEFVAYVAHDTEIGAPQQPRGEAVVRGEPIESVAITSPAEGRHIRRGSVLRLTVDVEPADKFLSLRLFANGTEVASRENELSPILLDTSGYEPGECTLEAEARFTNWQRVRSAPVHVEVIESE